MNTTSRCRWFFQGLWDSRHQAKAGDTMNVASLAGEIPSGYVKIAIENGDS